MANIFRFLASFRPKQNIELYLFESHLRMRRSDHCLGMYLVWLIPERGRPLLRSSMVSACACPEYVIKKRDRHDDEKCNDLPRISKVDFRPFRDFYAFQSSPSKLMPPDQSHLQYVEHLL